MSTQVWGGTLYYCMAEGTVEGFNSVERQRNVIMVYKVRVRA